MVALKVIGTIILVIFLIGLIPIGADVSYEKNELSVSAKIGSLLVKLYPKDETGDETGKKKKEKEKKDKKQPDNQQNTSTKPKRKLKLNFTVDEILALIKKVLKGLGKLLKIKISRFKLNLVVTGDDPYNTAVTYGAINAALSAMLPLCEERFGMKNETVHTDVNFMADSWSVDFGIALTIRIGQIFGALNTILFGALGILIKNKIRLRKERRNNPDLAEKMQSSEQKETENTEVTFAEEKIDSDK